MIEKDFSPIDDDFITFWSRYMTTDDLPSLNFFETLEKLAELGQVDALQKCYESNMFDKEVCFISRKTEEQCNLLGNDYQGRLVRLFKNYKINGADYPNAEDMFVDEFLGEYSKTIVLAKIDYEENGNILSGEKYIELVSNIPYLGLRKSPKSNMIFLEAKRICQKLEKLYNENSSSAMAFALGRNLIFFGQDEDTKTHGREILHTLANREYLVII